MSRPLASALVFALLGCPVGLRAMTFEVCDDRTEFMDLALIPDAPEGAADLAVVCNPAGAVTIGGHVELWQVDPAARRVARFEDARNPREIVAGDLDGDGDGDLLLVNEGQHERSLAAILNDGKGAFAAPNIVHARGAGTEGPVVHDVNGDGRVDVLLGEGRGWGRVGALIDQGDAAFGPFREGPLPGRLNASGRRIVFDGTPALAAPLPRAGKIAMYLGGSDARREISLGKAARRVEAVLGGGDLDGDGIPELFVATRKDASTLDTRIATSRDGDSWRIGPALGGADDARDLLLLDLDGDPGLEILLTTKGDLRRGERIAHLFDFADESAVETGRLRFDAHPYRLEAGELLPANGPELVYGTQETNEIRIISLQKR